MNNRQLGKIKLDSQFFWKSPDKILKVFRYLDFVPYKIEETETNIEYIGVCPEFKEVPLGSVIPEYDLNINSYYFKGVWDVYNIFVTPKEDEIEDKAFEDLYHGYVIRNKNSNVFISSSDDTCRFRSIAERFTKKEAMAYIQRANNNKLVIEDAK
jgi:hypothetical protein